MALFFIIVNSFMILICIQAENFPRWFRLNIMFESA